MLDDLNMRRGQDGARPDRARQPESPIVGDREVPINPNNPLDAMHRWLDGEGRETDARRDPESARHVELWHRLGAELGERRQEAAPAGLTDRIMASIPSAFDQAGIGAAQSVVAGVAPLEVARASVAPASVAPATAAGWWQRPMELNPATILAAAAGLVALGLAIGVALRG